MARYKIKSLLSHKGFMKYFKNTSWLFAEKILRMVVGLFVGIWVARYLGHDQFGLFSYVQSFVGLFIVVSTLGLDGIVVRELVKDPTKREVLLGTAFVLKILGAIGVFFLVLIAINFTSNDSYTNMMILIISSSIIFQAFNVIDFYFQSKVLSKYIVYVNIVSLLLSSILKIYFILNQAELIFFVWIMVFDNIVLAVGFIYFYKQQGNFFKEWRYSKRMALEMLKDSYPLILAGVINSIYMRIDQVMIKEMLNIGEVGYYAAATRLSEAWFAIGIIISNSLFPAIINAKEISRKMYYERIQKLFIFLVFIAYILTGIVYFLSDKIIYFLYGEEFIKSSSVLIIHIFSAIFVYLGVSSGKWLIIENKTKINLYRNIFGMLINIFLNIIWIEKYGIIGAAYASLTAYICAFYLFDIFLKDTQKIFMLKTKALLLWK